MSKVFKPFSVKIRDYGCLSNSVNPQFPRSSLVARFSLASRINFKAISDMAFVLELGGKDFLKILRIYTEGVLSCY